MGDVRERALEILRLLKEEYPEVRCALNFNNPFELLIATILSAQSTDATINKLTPQLFKKYRGPVDFARAPLEELEQDIKSSGFYRNKARNIKAASQMIVERFGSEVPRSMEELVQLPGVARKTANIVLSTAYGIVEGIAVDTHVKRLSNRLGLTNNGSPDKIEQDLMALFPREDWDNLSLLLIQHGRKVCNARKPRCDACVISHLCPSSQR
jgi:endonuclease-3